MSIYETGIEKYSLKGIIFRNFLIILWIATGIAACWSFQSHRCMDVPRLRRPDGGDSFEEAGLCKLLLLWKRWCYLGWGKLSALLFRKGEMEKFSSSPGMKFAPFTYGILTADRSSSFSF